MPFPLISSEHLDLVLLVGLLSFAFAGGVWRWGWRVSPWWLALLTAVGLLLVGMVVATCSTERAAQTVTLAYFGMAVYYGCAFSRRMAAMQWLLFAVSFGAALLLRGFPHMAAYWAIFCFVVLIVALAVNQIIAVLNSHADTDPLTGLLNRRGLRVAARREHEMAARTKQPLAVAIIDVDGFKQVNDVRGHLAGDRLLTGLARSWEARLRPGDILARHGGDEFVLVLPSTLLGTAEGLLAGMRDAVARVEGIAVSWSYGVSMWRRGETLEACLQQADRALYERKGSRDLR